jgi:hypothetical protein
MSLYSAFSKNLGQFKSKFAIASLRKGLRGREAAERPLVEHSGCQSHRTVLFLAEALKSVQAARLGPINGIMTKPPRGHVLRACSHRFLPSSTAAARPTRYKVVHGAVSPTTHPEPRHQFVAIHQIVRLRQDPPSVLEIHTDNVHWNGQ